MWRCRFAAIHRSSNRTEAARTATAMLLGEAVKAGLTAAQAAYVLATAEHESNMGNSMVENRAYAAQPLKSNEIKLVSLGDRPTNRGVRDYRTAIGKLIKNLRANPESEGVVFGYFLERPGRKLQRRLREVTKTLEQSGLPANRYLVRPMRWNDEVSTSPPDAEPQYPIVYIIEVVRDTAQR